ENDAVNASWMCDYGRLNYKWINREDRLREVMSVGPASRLSPAQKENSETCATPVLRKSAWSTALKEISELLNKAPQGSVAIIASSRQTNEELWLLKKLATRLNAVTDTVAHSGDADKLLLNADRSPNRTGARLIGICDTNAGNKLPTIAD